MHVCRGVVGCSRLCYVMFVFVCCVCAICVCVLSFVCVCTACTTCAIVVCRGLPYGLPPCIVLLKRVFQIVSLSRKYLWVSDMHRAAVYFCQLHRELIYSNLIPNLDNHAKNEMGEKQKQTSNTNRPNH